MEWDGVGEKEKEKEVGDSSEKRTRSPFERAPAPAQSLTANTILTGFLSIPIVDSTRERLRQRGKKKPRRRDISIPSLFSPPSPPATHIHVYPRSARKNIRATVPFFLAFAALFYAPALFPFPARASLYTFAPRELQSASYAKCVKSIKEHRGVRPSVSRNNIEEKGGR